MAIVFSSIIHTENYHSVGSRIRGRTLHEKGTHWNLSHPQYQYFSSKLNITAFLEVANIPTFVIIYGADCHPTLYSPLLCLGHGNWWSIFFLFQSNFKMSKLIIEVVYCFQTFSTSGHFAASFARRTNGRMDMDSQWHVPPMIRNMTCVVILVVLRRRMWN